MSKKRKRGDGSPFLTIGLPVGFYDNGRIAWLWRRAGGLRWKGDTSGTRRVEGGGLSLNGKAHGIFYREIVWRELPPIWKAPLRMRQPFSE